MTRAERIERAARAFWEHAAGGDCDGGCEKAYALQSALDSDPDAPDATPAQAEVVAARGIALGYEGGWHDAAEKAAAILAREAAGWDFNPKVAMSLRECEDRIRALSARWPAPASAREEGWRAGLASAAAVADHWELQYPPDIFPPESTSLDAKAAGHGRHVAKMIGQDIRALLSPAP